VPTKKKPQVTAAPARRRELLDTAAEVFAEQGYNATTVRNVGWRAQAGQAHYAAAKAGVMALTRCAAMEAAGYGVRVNAVPHPSSRRPAGQQVA